MRCLRLLAASFVLAALAATARADGKGTILLTGFEPFEGPKNPSWEAVKNLNGTEVNGYRVVALELPVEWKRGAESLEAAIREVRPVAVISFGEGLPGQFSLEEVAHNHADPNLEDNAHENWTAPQIRTDGPATFSSTLPLAEIEAALAPLVARSSSGATVARSQDPGSYLCEYVFYLDRYFLQKYHLDDSPAGFIHVPYVSETETDFSLDASAASASLHALADALDARLPAPPLPPIATIPTTVTPPVPAPVAVVPLAPAPDPLPVLARGAKGDDVVQLQDALRAAGFSPGASDGDFGKKTLAALLEFQSKRGLAPSGVSDAATWDALGVKPSATIGIAGGLR